MAAAIREPDRGCEVASDTVIGVRLSAKGSLLTPADVCEVIPALCESADIDYVNVTVGVRGAYVPDMATAVPPLLGGIARLRAATPVPLLVCAGFRAPDGMERALAAGADLVGMTRGLIADPELPNKLLGGRADEVRPCVACNEDCRSFTPSLLCTVNPELAPPGYRIRPALPLLVQAAAPGRDGRPVAVVGAGPAGLECAVTLAREGRPVEIFEAATRLGGTLATTASAPHRSGWGSLIGYYEALVRRLPITLHLGVEANASALDGFGEIVLATGTEESRGAERDLRCRGAHPGGRRDRGRGASRPTASRCPRGGSGPRHR